MPDTTGTTGPADNDDDARLAPTFVGIVFVQLVVVLGLYWLGRHFS